MPGDAMLCPAADLPPQRAAVAPRARRRGCAASLPLAELVLPVIRSMTKGIVLITAPPGGGITTALRHLRAVFPDDLRVQIFDPDRVGPARREARDCPVVLGATAPFADEHCLEHFSLSGWTLDDCIEYLVARHLRQCRSVIARLKEDQSLPTVSTSPGLLKQPRRCKVCPVLMPRKSKALKSCSGWRPGHRSVADIVCRRGRCR